MEEDVDKRRDDVMYERLYHKYHLHQGFEDFFHLYKKCFSSEKETECKSTILLQKSLSF